MTRALFAALVLVTVLLSSVALAGPAVVAVEATVATGGSRALQSMTLQALTYQGLETADPEVLQVPVRSSSARELAAQGGAARLFVLRLASMDDAVLASLEEVSLEDGRTLGRASLLIQSPVDSPLHVARLVRAVVSREPLAEGRVVRTLTEAEVEPFSSQPGEFFFGVTFFGGIGAANIDTIPGVYGGNGRFFYELPHANFGVTVGAGGSAEMVMFEATIRAHYLFSEADTSGYLGGGLGISFVAADHRVISYGAHFVLSGGVEAFRHYATRLVVGIDVMLPAYALTGDTKSEWDLTNFEPNETKRDDVYMVVPMATIALMF